VRSVEELRRVDDPAWPGLQEQIAAAGVPVVVLPVARGPADEALHRLQVTAASTLGALAAESGGLLVDHGWFRILGGGCDGLVDLATANDLPAPSDESGRPGFLVVAYDALGGTFAIDGGGLGIAHGEVCYLGPDTLTWGGLGGGRSAFVAAALSGALGDVFASLRWPGWEAEVSALAADQGISLYPPPFTTEGADLSAVSRRPVPLTELVDLYDEASRRLADVPDGQAVELRLTD